MTTGGCFGLDMNKNTNPRVCREEGCTSSQPYFGTEGTFVGAYCAKHGRLRGCVKVVKPKCAVNGCGKAKIYGLAGDPPSHCSIHGKELGMVDVRNMKCECGKVQPRFAREGEQPVRCSKCRLEGDVNVVTRKCECGKAQPRFAQEGEPPTRCSKCRLDGDVDVVTKKCECGKSKPHFAQEGEPPTRCSKCRLDGDVDVVNKKCECGKSQPTFAKEGEPPTRCKQCRRKDDVDVVHCRCECGKAIPHFAQEGEPPARCSKCRLEGDMNVVTRKCECGKAQPHFAQEGKPPTRCSKCRLDGDVDVVIKRCAVNGCYTRPCYGVTGTVESTHCQRHGKPLGLVNVYHKKCAVVGCHTIVVPEYTMCADHDHDNTRRRRFGEALARDILKETFPREDGWVLLWNNRVGFAGDASNKIECFEEDTLNSKNFEGDFFLTNPTKYPGRVFYGEHDEEQHKNYLKPCDAGRTCAILQWRTYNVPILMARINPDSYVLAGKHKVRGWQNKNTQTKAYERDSKIMKKRYKSVIRDIKAYFEMPLEDLSNGPDVNYNLYFYDNPNDICTVQRYSLQGPNLNEFGQVISLNLQPLN